MRRILALLLLLPLAQADAATRRVPSEYSTIQLALDASSPGDTVLVAPGTYTDSELRGTVFPRRSCAFMTDGVVLRSESGPEVTTIDMLGVSGAQAAVVWCDGLPSLGTLIEGFTLTGAPVNYRAAWVIAVGKVTFRDCIFRDLNAGESTGGGLAAAGDVDVEACLFVNCLADAGGAIYQAFGHLSVAQTAFRECGDSAVRLAGDSNSTRSASALLVGCEFSNNWGGGAGAVSAFEFRDGVEIRECLFVSNQASAGLGGSIALAGGGSKLVENCLFLRNAILGGSGQGGAIAVGGTGSCVIRGNTFYGNSQAYPFLGGATLYAQTSVAFEQNVVTASLGSSALFLETNSVPPGELISSCNVYWANEDGLGVPLGPMDRVVDPQFCGSEAGDLTVARTSPCLEPGSLGCGQIGALGEGCGPLSIEPASWARIKAMFQE